MRYGIFSDIHSNLEALSAVMADFQKNPIDAYLCAGDVVGYGANPNECVERIRKLAQVTIAGNHDWGSVDLFSLEYFNPDAKEGIVWTKKNLNASSRYLLETLQLTYQNNDLTLVHGTLDDPQEFYYLDSEYAARNTFHLLETRVCFIGHTHAPLVFIKGKDNTIQYSRLESVEIEPDNQYIVNVGSVGQPRDGNPDACYCIYDTENREVRLKRIPYDYQTARRKIIQKGLPRFLGDRLVMGR